MTLASDNRSQEKPLGFFAVPLAWLIPGAGHIALGQIGRGILFAAVIHLLFAGGMLIGGIRAINPPDQAIWSYTQFITGWPMLVANRLERAKAGELDALLQQYSDLYAERYGVRREFDNGPGSAERKEKLFQEFAKAHPNVIYAPKVQDIGAVYCGIAGMLNLLVIFDVLLRVTGSTRIAKATGPAGRAA